MKYPFQLNLIPFGLNNIHIPSNDIQQLAFEQDHELPPPGADSSKRWQYGEVEFEALMRQLDAAVRMHVLTLSLTVVVHVHMLAPMNQPLCC